MTFSPHQSSSQEDNELMVSLSRGNDAAMTLIIDRWQRPVTSFLYRTVGNYETAVDLSQEVFVKLYQKREKYEPGKSCSSYIFTIATNLAKNHFRWRNRHPETQMDDELGMEIAGENVSHTNPGHYLEKSEDAVEVRSAILTLPEKLRIPVILFYFQELSHAAIAEILKCSEKSIENRLYRARNRLKSQIGAPKTLLRI